MLGSPRDLKVRSRFQQLVYQIAPRGGTILDFGAGTGIDAKAYAQRGFKVLVCEPCAENRTELVRHCCDELESGNITITDLTVSGYVHVIAANFAVLNLVADPSALFATFDRVLESNGRVVASLLNPFFACDARFRWWRENFLSLLRSGRYAVEGDDGPVYRFTPAAISLAAQPMFRRITLLPRGPGLAICQYMFMVFQKI
jgi:2-polyprenyl-3-methyl-5-hydroxy-6-metoxy-1,4-benzoquinol methylase